MSLALHLSPDARLDLANLDPRLQEDVLDELERLLDEPSLLPPLLPGVGMMHVFARAYEERLHVIRLHLSQDERRRVLNVLGGSANARRGVRT